MRSNFRVELRTIRGRLFSSEALQCSTACSEVCARVAYVVASWSLLYDLRVSFPFIPQQARRTDRRNLRVVTRLLVPAPKLLLARLLLVWLLDEAPDKRPKDLKFGLFPVSCSSPAQLKFGLFLAPC